MRVGWETWMVRFCLAAALGIAAAAWVRGQAVAGAEVDGTVTDPSGSPLPGAQVTMIESETQAQRATTTDQTGHYVFPNLPVGPYTLSVSAKGFKTYQQSNIVLAVAQNITINVSMVLGAVSQTVEVSAQASMVETKDNSISQVVDERRINDLPLNGRQATQLILISGASTPAPSGDMATSKNFFSSVTYSVAGGQANGTNYYLDGGDNNDTMTNVNLPFPFPDALQEFSVETNSLPARNGLHPGGVVNVVTASGTNAIHGDLFEYFRNGDVNARNYFAAVHDSLKRNQYGGTIGGAIVKDKLFYFGGYQGTYIRTNPPQQIAFVPTQAALNGDFSALESAACQSNHKARTLIDPSTGAPFPGDQIPVSRFDPAALKLATKYLPAAQNACGETTYSIPNPNQEGQYIGRIDYNQSSKNQMFGRYFADSYSAPGQWNPQDILVTQNPGNSELAQAFTFGDTYLFGPNTINSFHATFTRRRDDRGPNASDINARDLGINMFTYVPNDFRLSVSNSFDVGCGICSPGFFNVNTFQEADDLDVIRGKHQMAFGVDIIRTQNNTNAGYLQNGSFSMNGQFTKDPLADFLLGDLSGFSQSRAQQVAMRETILGLYAQDTIHVSQTVVLNFGLRWEPMMFPVDVYGRGSVFSLAAFEANQHSSVYVNAPAGSFYYGDPGVNKAFTNDDLAVFSPRVGLVWNPHGDGRDSIRIGGAIMHDSTEVWYSQRLTSNPPVVNEIDLTSSGPLSNPWLGYPGGNPFPGVFPPPKNAAFPTQALYVLLPPNMQPPTITQWNATYQRQLPQDWMFQISYLGNATRHLWIGNETNPSFYIPGTCNASELSSCTKLQQAHRFLNLINPVQGNYYGGMPITDAGANASYNAMFVSIQRRFTQNFTFLANYTWSHCISQGNFSGDLTGGQFENPFNLAMDTGDCNFDVRHIFNTSIVALSPIHGSDWKGKILGNWQLSPLLRMTSGMPINITTGQNWSLNDVGLDRPNQILPNVLNSVWGPNLNYINSAAYTHNAIGTYGNVGAYDLAGPGLISLDVALVRYFPMTERFQLEVRGEAFNAINHTNFNNPNATQTSATFGRITSAGDPRIFQFALKLHF